MQEGLHLMSNRQIKILLDPVCTKFNIYSQFLEDKVIPLLHIGKSLFVYTSSLYGLINVYYLQLSL